MRGAQESTVLNVGCDEDGIMIVTKFEKPSGPVFYYDPPTNESFGAGPEGRYLKCIGIYLPNISFQITF